jgi:hypothetical protein
VVWRFEVMYYLHLRGLRVKSKTSNQQDYRLHGVTSQKVILLTVNTLRAVESSPKSCKLGSPVSTVIRVRAG